MKQVSISKVKQLTAQEIKDGGCFEIISDGEPVAIVIVGAIEEMKQRITASASQIDLARGK